MGMGNGQRKTASSGSSDPVLLMMETFLGVARARGWEKARRGDKQKRVVTRGDVQSSTQ